jgi:hypothetical protein
MLWLAAAALTIVVTDVVVAQTSATAPVTFYKAAIR